VPGPAVRAFNRSLEVDDLMQRGSSIIRDLDKALLRNNPWGGCCAARIRCCTTARSTLAVRVLIFGVRARWCLCDELRCPWSMGRTIKPARFVAASA